MGFAGVHRHRDRAQRIYGGANQIMKESSVGPTDGD
jgi:hypothetical protein